MKPHFIICENQCLDLEHEHFNAALIATVLEANESAEVTFLAETRHLEHVRHRLLGHDSTKTERVTWKALTIPSRTSEGWPRATKELATIHAVIAVARQTAANGILFCSTTHSNLLLLKSMAFLRCSRIPVLVFLHGQLLTAIRPDDPDRSFRLLLHSLRRPWRRWITPLKALRFPAPPNVRLVTPGSSIHENLIRMEPSLKNRLESIEHPYFWHVAGLDKLKLRGGTLRFGFLGSGFKGLGTFHRLGADVLSTGRHAEFKLVGHLPLSNQSAELLSVFGHIPDAPLSSSEYESGVRELTFVVIAFNPERYRLSASATFLDALGFVKPVICIRNSYVERCFEKLGDVGYLCDTYEELRSLVCRLIDEFPVARYNQQCENILRGRDLFSPQRVSQQLRRILQQVTA